MAKYRLIFAVPPVPGSVVRFVYIHPGSGMGTELSSDSIVRLESAIIADCAAGMAFSSVNDSVRKNMNGVGDADGDGDAVVVVERVGVGGGRVFVAVRVGIRSGVRDAVRDGTAALAVAVFDKRGGVLDAVLVGMGREMLAVAVYERDVVAARDAVAVLVAASGRFGVLDGHEVTEAVGVAVSVCFFAKSRAAGAATTWLPARPGPRNATAASASPASEAGNVASKSAAVTLNAQAASKSAVATRTALLAVPRRNEL